ncbi:MAG: shikimate kinase [Rhodospirillales bacterium]
MPAKADLPDPDMLREYLGTRSIVLVGLMGAGKTSVGRRLAQTLGLPFVDADQEIEEAAGCTIEDFFELYGEPAFREGEERVIERLLSNGPQVLSTGGGAFMSPTTRQSVTKSGISVWLKADLDTLLKRTSRRNDRPLLKGNSPKETLRRLIDERYPVYAESDVTIESSTESVEASAKLAIRAIADYLEGLSSIPADNQ